MKAENTGKTNSKKVSIIGAGAVGSSIAYSIMLKNIATEVVIIDINKDLCDAEALDIRHGISEMGATKVVSGDYSDVKDSDLIIITAGRNRKPDETRLDLAKDNIKIAQSIAEKIKEFYTKGIVLVVSNPVDVITNYMIKWLDLPEGKVFGSGCHLDSSRFTNILSDFLNIPPQNINSMVIGEHGESQVHLWSKVTVNNLPLIQYCKNLDINFSEEQKELIEKRVTGLGAEIIKGKGKTNYGIATCVSHIAQAVLNDKEITASVTVEIDEECEIDSVSMSIPCKISSKGAEKVLLENLTPDECSKLQASALAIKNFLN